MTACSNAASSAAGVLDLGGGGEPQPVRDGDRRGQRGPPLRVGQPGQVHPVGVQQLEAEQPHRHVLHGLVDAVLAPPEHDLAERVQLPRGRVVRDDLPLQDRLARPQPRGQRLDDVGELRGHPLQPAGEQLDRPVRGPVRLHPDAVVLVLRRALPAQLGQDLVRLGEPLGQHGPHRVARADLDLLGRRQAAGGQGGGDPAQVAADVVGAFQHRPGGPPAGVDLGQRVQDGGRADAQPQPLGDQAQQVAGLQRGGLAEQPGQQVQLAALRPLSLGRGDLVQGVHHGGDRQRLAGRSAAGGQQLLGGQAEIPGLPQQGGDLPGFNSGGGGDRADGELLGQAQVHPGELRRDQPLAQVTHHRQQFGRGLGEQRRQPVHQRQPPAGLLQVPVGLGHSQVLHAR